MNVSTEVLLAAALTVLAVVAWPGVSTGAVEPRTPRRVPGPWRGASILGRTTSIRDRNLDDVHLLDALAAALEAGMPTERALSLALESAGSSGRLPEAWTDLRRSAELGLPLAPAWARAARRTASPTLAGAARAWSVATASGAPLATAVRSSAHSARERHRLARTVEIATAGARATATVLGLLPLAGVGLAAMLGIDPMTLYGSGPAIVCAGAGITLLLMGHLAVRAMVDRVLAGLS